jgi:hypothetical protein
VINFILGNVTKKWILSVLVVLMALQWSFADISIKWGTYMGNFLLRDVNQSYLSKWQHIFLSVCKGAKIGLGGKGSCNG